MWRPDNWEDKANNFELGGRVAYETGADAMLEALEKEADGQAMWFGRTDSGDLLIYVGAKNG